MPSLNQSYHRVATIAEAKAEDSSQAAARATIHALWIEGSPDMTMCGKVESLDTKRMGVLRVVSCGECQAAIKKVRQRNSRDGHARMVERRRQDAEQAEREQFAADEREQALRMKNERDAAYLQKLRECCGFVENGSQEMLTIAQDDATRGWRITIGASHTRSYHADGFYEVIDMAHAVEKQEF